MNDGAGIRFPTLRRRGLGIGLDLRWGDPVGFIARPDGSDGIAPALRAFLAAETGACAHAFFSWQPRDRGRLRLADYAPAWDQLCALLPPALPRALHHTALNLAALGGAPRTTLLDFTNALCDRYDLGWVNEDVGFWSVAGKPVPYPLPPLLDAAGLRACIRNVRECQRALQAPLVLEFPGFSAGVSLVMGAVDAYDHFRELCGETAAPVTLDIAHLLSWRWWQGFRGEALFDHLERLPLAHAFEIHLSGCEIVGDRFIDAHHGRLLDEQFTLLQRLLPLCPNLRAVTFEDPRVDEAGALEPASARSLARLRALLAPWIGEAPQASSPAAPGSRTRPPEITTPIDAAETVDASTESALGALLFDSAARAGWCLQRRSAGVVAQPWGVFDSLDAAALEETAAAVRAMVRDRRHRGTGCLEDAFPRTVAAWRGAHPEDTGLDRLFDRFLSSPAAAPWREWPGEDGGASLEECFADFARAERLIDPLTCQEELLSSMLRSLTVSPDPAFRPPRGVQRAPGGWFAVQAAADPPVLHAALAGRYLCGPITPLVAALLGQPNQREAASPAAAAPTAVGQVRARLVEMGLLDRQ
ncbi:MAG TPA: DUF692 family protein [Polyangia bacterium]|nr:DUF692 family protein [Polyangia bacterium]